MKVLVDSALFARGGKFTAFTLCPSSVGLRLTQLLMGSETCSLYVPVSNRTRVPALPVFKKEGLAYMDLESRRYLQSRENVGEGYLNAC